MPVADETAHLRADARFVPATAGYGIRANDLASAGPARQGGRTGGAAHAESADQNEYSVSQRDQRYQWAERQLFRAQRSFSRAVTQVGVIT